MRVVASCFNCRFFRDGLMECWRLPEPVYGKSRKTWCGEFNALAKYDDSESLFSKTRPTVIWPTDEANDA